MKSFFLVIFSVFTISLFSQKSIEGSFRYENDFFNATDRYYTQGIFLGVKFSTPRVGDSSILINEFSLSQLCFTPASIRRDSVFPGDRPFASAALVTIMHGNIIYTNRSYFGGGWQVGALGPCTGCETTQKTIHQWLDNIQPLGWEKQLPFMLLVNLNIQKRKNVLFRNVFEADLDGTIRVGNLKTGASFSTIIRGGSFTSYWKPQDDKKYEFFAEGFVSGILTFHDATYSGRIFKNEEYSIPFSHMKKMTYEFGVRPVIRLNKIFISYFRVWSGKTFDAGRPFGWGGVDFRLGL